LNLVHNSTYSRRLKLNSFWGYQPLFPYIVLLRSSKQIPVEFRTYHRHSTCPTNHIIIQVIILAVFGQEYETRISRICCFFSVVLFLRLSQFQIFSSAFFPNILQWKMEWQPVK
jgi:hypothetical protein